MSVKVENGRGSNVTKRATRKSHSIKAGLQFPVGRVARFLRKGRFAARVGSGAPIFLAAVLEYLVAEILELAGIAGERPQEVAHHWA